MTFWLNGIMIAFCHETEMMILFIFKQILASFSKDHMHPVSVRDVKKRELSRRGPGDYQLDDDMRYSG